MSNRYSTSVWRILTTGMILLVLLTACASLPLQHSELFSSDTPVDEISASSTQSSLPPTEILVGETPTLQNPPTQIAVATPANLEFDPSSLVPTQNWQPSFTNLSFAIDPHEHFYFQDNRCKYVLLAGNQLPVWIYFSRVRTWCIRYRYAAPLGTPIFAAAYGYCDLDWA